MRKPRDIDAELKALQDRQQRLKARRTTQLGELVEATGAAALPLETLTGALLEAAARLHDENAAESWRRRGEAFFREPRRPAAGAGHDAAAAAAGDGGAAAG